jgi:hypothetical protein
MTGLSKRRTYAAAVAVALALASSTSRAAPDSSDEEDDTEPQPSPPRRPLPVVVSTTYESYGWQTLLVDTVALALVGVGWATTPRSEWDDGRVMSHALFRGFDMGKAPTVMDVGFVLSAVGPAGIHLLHRRLAPALQSAGLRLEGPALGALAGMAVGAAVALPLLPITSKAGSEIVPIQVGAVAGLGVGFIAPMFIDAFELARVPTVHVTQGAARRLTPAFSIGSKSAFFGLATEL